jgi:phage terminase large subunit
MATIAELIAGLDWKKPDYTAVYQERARRLKNIRDNPDIVPGLKEFYKTHPVEFINDWGMTFDPRNIEIGLPAVVPFLMFPRQAEFIDWVRDKWMNRKDGLAEKSRDMGVSWLCVGFSVWMWLFYPGAVVGFGSRKEEYVDNVGDPKSLFWKIRQFIALLPYEFRPAGWDERKHAPFMKITNPENGASIIGEAGKNIGRGNRTSIYFKDESAFYEQPQAIDAALSQTSNCKIDISTPNGPGNPFALKRQGGKIAVFTFNWRQDPRKDEAWYQKQKETLDPVIVAQEVDIDYSASMGDAFIPGVAVEAAMQLGAGDLEAIGPLQLGVDPARFGDDKSVITARRGRVVLKQLVFQKLDTMSLAQKVKNEVDAYKAANMIVQQIAVDTIGIGSGVADRLRMFYPDKLDGMGQVIEPSIVVDVNSSLIVDDGENYNLRAQMWANGKAWLGNGPVSLPNDPDLKTDLTALKYKFRSGLLLIESKEDAKKRGIKSPDRADSLMLTFAYPVRQIKRAPVMPVVYGNPLDAVAGY